MISSAQTDTRCADGLSAKANCFVAEIGLALASGELDFPTSLEVARKIQRVLEDPNSSFEDIARVIKLEPVLSAKVLQLANSVAYNPSGRKVENLQQALSRIGMRPLRALAFIVVGEQIASANGYGSVVQKFAHALWQHSLDVATLAWALARKTHCVDPDTAMFAGMASQIGVFYLLSKATKHPDLMADYAELLSVMRIWHRPIARKVLQELDVADAVVAAIDESQLYGGNWPPAMLADLLFIANLGVEHPNPLNLMSPDERQKELEAVFTQLPREGFEALMSEAQEERRLSLNALN